MAEIYSGTGVTKTGLITVTKGFEGLLFTFDKEFDTLTTEKISIEVQRAGKNTQITNGWMSLRDFLLLKAAGEAAICDDVDGKLSVLCDLTTGGDIHLLEKEEVRIQLDGLKTADAWALNTVETFAESTTLFTYDQKIVSADQRQGEILTHAADLILMDNLAEVTDVRFHYSNGQTVQYTLRELRAMSRQIDPIAWINGAGAIKTGFADKIQLHVANVDYIEIYKAAGTAFNCFVRTVTQ
jgi:hypothetical protein